MFYNLISWSHHKIWLRIGKVSLLNTVCTIWLLFISYKFVEGFLAITFLLLVISSWNFHDVCQRFAYDQKRNFSLIRHKMRNLSIDPIIKIAHFCNVYRPDVTKAGDFYNGGLWGNYLSFVGSNWNFVSDYIKHVYTHHESFS